MSHHGPSTGAKLIPDVILKEYIQDTYLVCFKPNNAGIIPMPARLVSKPILAARFPSVVEAWNKQQREAQQQVLATRDKWYNFARRFADSGTKFAEHVSEPATRGPPCLQPLLPTMKRHWGELRECETHPVDKDPVRICKGCRIAHYEQEIGTFDRQLIMTRGARVSVCRECAGDVVRTLGVGYRGCECDSLWSCFQCREAELVELARAREGFCDGRCGMCEGDGELVENVEVCLRCREYRVYEELA